MSERGRRQIRNLLGSARASSNLVAVVFWSNREALIAERLRRTLKARVRSPLSAFFLLGAKKKMEYGGFDPPA